MDGVGTLFVCVLFFGIGVLYGAFFSRRWRKP